jgi:anti-sigma28 factor (negative regulator of flagellin synthesis)
MNGSSKQKVTTRLPSALAESKTLEEICYVRYDLMLSSDSRGHKVAALQARIATGTYVVSSSDIADKLVDAM